MPPMGPLTVSVRAEPVVICCKIKSWFKVIAPEKTPLPLPPLFER
jgi:hypothetical protein